MNTPAQASAKNHTITIVIADDHRIVRQGVRSLLETEPDFCIVGEASNGKEAVEAVEQLHPKVLLTDLMMPDLNGLEVLKQVRPRSPKTGVVILSMYDSDAYVLAALENGAAGYVLKEAGADVLVRAIREAASGRRFLSPPLSEERINAYRKRIRACEWKSPPPPPTH